MDKAGAAMLQGMALFGTITVLLAGGGVWLVRRLMRRRRGKASGASQ